MAQCECLAHLALSWLGFRIAELRACAEATGVELTIDDVASTALESRTDSVLLPLRVPDEESVRRLAERTVLAKSFVDVWASADSWDELAAALLAYPRDKAAPYLAKGTTFKVVVTSFGKKLTDAERMDHIRRLEPLLPWQGKVSLKAAQHTFVVFVDTPDAGTVTPSSQPACAGAYESGGKSAPGSQGTGAASPRARATTLGGRLRRAAAIWSASTTSRSATTSARRRSTRELSLLMANLARVRPHDLVYDPYCGTAGTLVAAGAFGARVLGCDLYLPAIKGELRTRSGPSKLKQAKVQGIPETFRQYGLSPPVDRLHGDSGAHLNFLRGGSSGGGGGGGLFDAIITDPPYGIRERPSEVADERLIARSSHRSTCRTTCRAPPSQRWSSCSPISSP